MKTVDKRTYVSYSVYGTYERSHAKASKRLCGKAYGQIRDMAGVNGRERREASPH